MSLLIKGLETPGKCGLCPCFHASYPMYCQAVPAEVGKRIVAPYEQPRPDWCPLVEVPPHGRLIDADSLKEQLSYYIKEAGWGEKTNEALTWVRDDFIDAERTIIPAED